MTNTGRSIGLLGMVIVAAQALLAPPADTSEGVTVHESGEAQLRDPYLWPFARTSIWNTPIGSGAVYVHANLKPAEKGAHIDEDVLITAHDQPLMGVYRTEYKWGPTVNPETRCIKGDDVALFWWPIPKDYVTNFHATRANHAAAVLMTDGRTIRSTQPFQVCSDGYATTHFVVDERVDILEGDGIAGSHGGSGMSSIGGTIRMGEMLPDSPPIAHALKVDISAKHNLYYDSATKGFRWPARQADKNAARLYHGTVEASRMGALLALRPEIDIENWGLLTEPGIRIARAFQDYGGYVVDDAFQDVFTLCTEEGPGRNVAAEFESVYGYPMKNKDLDHPWVKDIIRIFTNLHVVDNNGPGSIGGGGKPRAPLAPDFIPAYELGLISDGTPGVVFNFSGITTVIKDRRTRIDIVSASSDHRFSHWEVVKGIVQLEDPTSMTTYVRLQQGDAILKAHFEMEAHP